MACVKYPDRRERLKFTAPTSPAPRTEWSAPLSSSTHLRSHPIGSPIHEIPVAGTPHCSDGAAECMTSRALSLRCTSALSPEAVAVGVEQRLHVLDHHAPLVPPRPRREPGVVACFCAVAARGGDDAPAVSMGGCTRARVQRSVGFRVSELCDRGGGVTYLKATIGRMPSRHLSEVP